MAGLLEMKESDKQEGITDALIRYVSDVVCDETIVDV